MILYYEEADNKFDFNSLIASVLICADEKRDR